MPKIVKVIWTEERRGVGTEKDPVRLVPQLWTIDGELICEAEQAHNLTLDGSGHFEERVWRETLQRLGQ